jgi:tetratricopeptide (TPR) repeat protein
MAAGPLPRPFIILSIVMGSVVVGAQQGDDFNALDQQTGQLYWAGEYAEATDIAKRALAIDARALGAEHPDVAGDLKSLAGLYQDGGRYAEAEPLDRRALAINEKALGPDHPTISIRVVRASPVIEDASVAVRNLCTLR